MKRYIVCVSLRQHPKQFSPAGNIEITAQYKLVQRPEDLQEFAHIVKLFVCCFPTLRPREVRRAYTEIFFLARNVANDDHAIIRIPCTRIVIIGIRDRLGGTDIVPDVPGFYRKPRKDRDALHLWWVFLRPPCHGDVFTRRIGKRLRNNRYRTFVNFLCAKNIRHLFRQKWNDAVEMSVLFDVETDELQRSGHASFLTSDGGLDERIEKRMR